MKILSVNAGSSSMKFQLYNMNDNSVLVASTFERIGLNDSFYNITINGNKEKKIATLNTHSDAVEIFLSEILTLNVINDLTEIDAVGHRIVHGGDIYTKPVIVDDEVIKNITELSALAPLHNPAHVLGIKAIKEKLKCTNVVVFDTAFHQTMEKEAYIYPVPYDWYKEYNVRKYGFHGISHDYIQQRMSEILQKKDLKLIICHIGNGSSITAVKNGKCINTSMGFTPIAGIPMGTRCGDIDVSIIPYIMNKTNKNIDQIMNDLNKNSGLIGISNISADNRDIEEEILKNNEQAILTHNILSKRITGYISMYNTELEGADAIIFTAGLGENSSLLRENVINRLKVFDIYVDKELNKTRSKEVKISTNDSKIQVYIIPTNEELMIAKETMKVIR